MLMYQKFLHVLLREKCVQAWKNIFNSFDMADQAWLCCYWTRKSVVKPNVFVICGFFDIMITVVKLLQEKGFLYWLAYQIMKDWQERPIFFQAWSCQLSWHCKILSIYNSRQLVIPVKCCNPKPDMMNIRMINALTMFTLPLV
jgi:hypothetical protein